MKRFPSGTIRAGLLALGLAACASSKSSTVATEGMTLASAIRTAIPRAPGYTAVAAGVCEDDAEFFEVAFLDHGKVKRISVDAKNGSVERVGEGSVREGSESTAERLQTMLPGAKLDLARAVEIAVEHASGAPAPRAPRAIGVEVDELDGALVYLVTMIDGSRAMRTAVDAVSGAVLHTEERPTTAGSATASSPIAPEGSSAKGGSAKP